jgi:endonuclease/exonuclease/phosphatase family metal-dependent hydrolase
MENLRSIAGLTKDADILFLQEADVRWDGTSRINQALEIAEMTGFGFHFCHPHLRSPVPRVFDAIKSENVIMNRDLGTAILSRYPIVERKAHDFGQSFQNPLLRYCARVLNEFKGYTYAAIETPIGRIGAVSVHLINDLVFTITDFLGRGIHGQSLQRIRQVRRLVELIAESSIPMRIGGDLNMVPRESKLHFLDSRKGDRDDYRIALGMYLLREAGRIATIPELFGNGTPERISRYHTYPSIEPDRTLDYIFATREFEFEDYRVLPELVSDHRAVMARLRLGNNKTE